MEYQTEETNSMDEIIFEIGDMLHIRYKGTKFFGLFGHVYLTPPEIISSYEFKNGFENKMPKLSKFILDKYFEQYKSHDKPITILKAEEVNEQMIDKIIEDKQ